MIDLIAARELYGQMKARPRPLERPQRLWDFIPKTKKVNLSPVPVYIDWVVDGGKLTQPHANLLIGRQGLSTGPSDDEMLLSSLHFACLLVGKHLVDGGIYLRELDNSAKAVDELLVFWHKKGGISNAITCGYDALPESQVDLLLLLLNDGRAAKLIVERLAMNVAYSAPMQEWMRRLVFDLLTGAIKPMREPKREPTERQRDTLLVAIAEGIRDRTYYAGSAGRDKFLRRGPQPICGSTIAAAALRAFGIMVEAANADKIFRKKKELPMDQVDTRKLLSLPRMGASTLLEGEQADVTDAVMSALEALQRPIS